MFFCWHTLEDKTVSAENGYLFAEACRKAGVPYAHHVFAEGAHGMSVATEEWFEQKLKNVLINGQRKSRRIYMAH